MHLVSKHSKDKPSVTLRPLSVEEERMLTKYWETPQESRTAKELSDVGQLLSSIHHKGAWIECNCKKGAFMAPVEYKPGHFTLMRLSKRSSHAPGCAFEWEEGELGGGIYGGAGGDDSAHKLPQNIKGIIRLAPVETKAASGTPHTPGKPSKSRRTPRNELQTLLFWLLNKAGLNVIDGDTHQPNAMDRLVATLTETEVTKDLTLNDITWRTSRAITERWAESRFKSLEKRVHGKVKPIQLLIIVADKVDVQSGLLTDRNGIALRVNGRMACYGRDNGGNKPYLAIATIAREEDGAASLQKLYAHPIETASNLLIVDSNYERQATDVIRTFLTAVNKKGGGFTMTKPLEDYEVDGRGCRPDFIVHDHKAGKSLVIETMGSTEDAYRERKESTHELMRTLGDMYLDDRATINETEANESLRKALWRWYFKSHPKAN